LETSKVTFSDWWRESSPGAVWSPTLLRRGQHPEKSGICNVWTTRQPSMTALLV